MQVSYFKRYRMQIDLQEYGDFEDIALPPGIQLHAWNDALVEAHANAKHLSFQNEIDCNVFPCLGDADGCERLMNEISSRSGFVPEATWLMTWTDPLNHCTQSIGTVQGIREQKDVGSIQNIGITAQFRGMGLGTAIVKKCLAGFATVGVRFVTLEVTANNSRAYRLYERLGFRILKVVFKSAEISSVI
ncbi:GNAT family N-acetyltransferase [Mariniblastus fucicola]|uniref:Putative acetyltransferase n=1 Tax=Mariniblastus fucicola TaxID=980251 RepID=A0A5B9P5P4_9BACT|nr:GNAT family N-acetyltransferase [Mariniblastus fucicola]QEG20819.1 putative acetyltransferase [Mariniblastus fucicola]